MSSDRPHGLRELAETIGYELERQSVPSSFHIGGFPEARPDRVYVLLDPSGYASTEGEQALPGDAILKRTVFLWTSCPPDGPDDEQLELLRRAGAVFVPDQRAVIAMHRVRIPARLLRAGYSTSRDHFDPHASRPVDVTFLGTHSLRRTWYLSRAARLLSRYNCRLHICEDGAPADAGAFSSTTSPGQLLAETKVLINLHRTDEARLEWRHVLDAVHAGAVVVTEHSSGIAPLVAGEHLVVASPDSLPYAAEALLRDDERLASLRAAAYERLSMWIPYALPVSVLRAAVVELVGEPLRPGASLGTPRPQPADGARAVLQGTGLGDEEAEPARLGPKRIRVVHESPAWRARRRSLVTAIVALRGEPEQVLRALDSLARSRLRDFELVAIGSDVSGEVEDAVCEWMLSHPRIAARLVSSESSGVGAARNVGLDFARAPACLVLDVEHEIYPRCLEVLSASLDATADSAFVYPIEEVTGAVEAFVVAGGDYLLSFGAGAPAQVGHNNQIHQPPTLVRTSRLREVGGFAVDGSFRGADHDLSRRTADRGWRGELIPQVLCRWVAPES